MSGGKGGSETTEQKMDPDFKSEALQSMKTGQMLSKQAPIPYMGLVQAAPSDATRQAWTNVGDSANLLGVGMGAGRNIADSLPEHERQMGGQSGYTSHRGHQENLQRHWREYPELMQELEDYMPGVVSPAKTLQDNFKMFPHLDPDGEYQKNRKKSRWGSNYEDVANIYRGRFNV